MHVTYEGVSRLVMLDRYSYKDATKETLSEGDLVILTVKEDPKYPARGTGTVLSINHKDQTVRIKVSEEYQHNIDDFEVEEGGIVDAPDPDVGQTAGAFLRADRDAQRAWPGRG